MRNFFLVIIVVIRILMVVRISGEGFFMFDRYFVFMKLVIFGGNFLKCVFILFFRISLFNDRVGLFKLEK